MTRTNRKRLVGPAGWVNVLLLSSAPAALHSHKCAAANAYETDDATGQKIITATMDDDTMGIFVASDRGSFGDGEDYCPPCMEDHCAVCASIDFTCCVDPINNITSCVAPGGGNNETTAEAAADDDDGGCPAEFCGCGGGTVAPTTPSPRPTSRGPTASTISPTSGTPTSQTSTPSPAPPVPCADDEMEVVISILTDPYPGETHWNITKGDEEEVVARVQEGELRIPDNAYETRLCLSRSDDGDDDEPPCYGFTIGDAGGDGICCAYGLGEYALEVDGTTVAEGGEFGSTEETVRFGGGCGDDDGGGGVVTSSPSQSPSSSSSSFSSEPDEGDSTNGPTSPPTTSRPTNSPTGTPTSAEPSPDVRECTNDEMRIEIVVRTDFYPWENTWVITDDRGAVVAEEDGGNMERETRHETVACLDADGCYKFVMSDSEGDGMCCDWGEGNYTVHVDGQLVANGGEFGSNETTYLGTNCAPVTQSPSPQPSSKDPTPVPSSTSPTVSPTGDRTTTAQPSIAERTPQPTSPNPTPQPSPTPEPRSDLTPQPSPNSTAGTTITDATPAPTGSNSTPRPSLSVKPITEAPTGKGPTAQPTTPASPECPGNDEMSVVVLMRTDRYPQESYWKITDRGREEVVTNSQGQFGDDLEEETDYSASMCLDGRDCYEFAIEDSFGDGLCCEFGTGSYSLHADGDVIARGGEFEGRETAYFGRCCNGTTGTNVGACEDDDEEESTESPTSSPTTPRPTSNPTSQPSSSEPSRDPTARPTPPPQSTMTTAQPSPRPPPDCGASEMTVTVSLTTDRNPWENYWEITKEDGNVVVATSDDHIGSLEAETRHDVTICLPRDACYDLVVVDTESDGLCCKWGLGEYGIVVDGEVVGGGAKFERRNDITQFGTCCSGSDLETTFEDNNGSAGNMFDVLALTDVSIDGFDIHTIVNGSGVEVEVYTKAGSYNGHEQDEAAWTLVMSTRKVRGRGMGVGTALGCLDAPVSVAANSTQAFYVTATSNVVRYTNLERGVIAVKSNDEIKLSMGCGNEYKFGSSFPDRAWNGVLKYSRG